MEPANGDGWVELQDDGSLEGEISLLNGDNIPFIAPFNDFFNSLLGRRELGKSRHSRRWS
jgi:hypothetical protein